MALQPTLLTIAALAAMAATAHGMPSPAVQVLVNQTDGVEKIIEAPKYVYFDGYIVTKNTSDVGFHLESPNVTDFGSWGEPETCPQGSFVTGFQLKMEPKGAVDDTALNGIRFFCSSGENVTSRVGYFGNWGRTQSCASYAIGFELQSQPYQGAKGDDTAANNLKLICAEGNVMEGFDDNGHKFYEAYYTGARTCKRGQFICGLQTQVERYQTFADDTALNNIRVKCCSPFGVSSIPVNGVVDVLGVTSSVASSSEAPPSTVAAVEMA